MVDSIPSRGDGWDALFQAQWSQVVSFFGQPQRSFAESFFQRPTLPHDGRDNLPLHWNTTRDSADAGSDTREGTAGLAQQVDIILTTTTITVEPRQSSAEVDGDMAALARSISDRIDSRILVGIRYMLNGDVSFGIQETPRREGRWQGRFIQLSGGS